MNGADRERNILAFNLWGYDDTDYRVLRNAMVTTRAAHVCDICFQPISAGSRVRASTEVWDGKCMTFRICQLCCKAILADQRDGNCLHMDERTQIGMAAMKRKKGGSDDKG